MNHITHQDRQRPPPITYGCICSGLSAPTLAAKPLGWKTAFFSEIEAFPRAVLAHHYPGVPLHGDFTTIERNTYGTVDLLVGGTLCHYAERRIMPHLTRRNQPGEHSRRDFAFAHAA